MYFYIVDLVVHGISDASCSVLQEEPQTPPKKRAREPRYVGDIGILELSTPKRAKRCLDLAKRKLNQQATKIKALKQKNRRLAKQVHDLKGLLHHLKNKNLISETCAHSLEVATNK